MIRTALKWILVGIFAVIVVGVVTVELISWNFLKPWIVEQVGAATGRELSIDGDVEVDLVPRPRITLHEASLSNPDWAEAPNLIELDRLRLAPDLLALTTGRLALARIDVDAPEIRLQARQHGAPNWVLEGSGEAGTGPVPVNRLNVTSGVIEYRPAGGGEALTFRTPSLRLRDDGEALSLAATVAFRDRQIEIEGDTDSFFSATRAVEPFDGHLRIRAAESRIASEFSLSHSSFPTVWQSRIEADIEDVDHWMTLVPGAGPTGIGALTMEASLARSGSIWRAEKIGLTAMESSLQGSFEVDTAGKVPQVSGSIRSNSLNWTALRDARPTEDDSASKRNSIPRPPVLPRLAGSLDIDIEQISGLAVPVSGATAEMRFGKHSLAVEDVDISVGGGSAHGSVRLTSSPDSVSGRAAISTAAIAFGEEDGRAPTLGGDFDIRLEAVSREQWNRATLVSHLVVEAARLDYANPAGDTNFSLTGRLSEEGRRPVVKLAGTFAGRPLDAEIEGDSLVGGRPGRAYGLEVRATSRDLALSVDTTLDSALNAADRFEGRVSLSGDSIGNLGPWLGFDAIPTPAFHATGLLGRDGPQWRADEFSLELGGSVLRGEVRVDAGERPVVAATLAAEPLDLGWLNAASGEAAESSDPVDSARSSENVNPDLTWLRAFDADLELDATELILSNAPRLDSLELGAALQAGVLEVGRFSAGVAGGGFSFEGRLDAAETPAGARISARFDNIALGRLADTFSPLEERLGRVSGSADVQATQSLDEAFRGQVVAPMIGRLRIESSEFRFTDAEAGTDLRFSAATEGLADEGQRFRLDGSGRYDGKPAWLRYRSDALLDIRAPDRPYAVDLDVSVVESHIELDGTLLRPLALEGMDLRLSIGGPNPQRLSRLLGVPLPDLPPYRAAGRLELSQDRWSLSDLDGTVGESDLRGRLTFDVGPSPPRLTGELRSDSLDIDDLGGVAGVEPSEREGRAKDRFVLPDDPLVGEAWRAVSADLRYRGKSVRAGNVPLSDLVIDFRLADGHAHFEPVGFGVGDGSVDFILDLDARPQPAEGTLSVEVRGVDLRDAFEDWNLADESAGIIGAQGKFWVTGESIAELLASADGGLVMLMAGGRLEAVLVELAGLDASQAFFSWLGDRQAIPINCAYVDLKARSGLVRVDTFVIDTEDTIFTAGGQVDLDDERMDLSVVAHPQDASVLIGRTPFHFGGTFDDIETGLHGGELAIRLGTGAGLAALASPLAAMVPLLEAGVDDRTGYCQGLVGRTMDALESGGDG